MSPATILSTTWGIVSAIIAFGALICIHELGHFLAARMVGIGVEVFSIGLGKPIVSFKGKETIFQIGFLPFGGYCKMAGEHLEDALDGKVIQNEDTEDTDPIQHEQTFSTGDTPGHIVSPEKQFYNKSVFARLFAVSAGVIMNLIAAIIVLTIMFAVGYKEPDLTAQIYVPEPEIAHILNLPTIAYTGGLRTGDIITAINDEPVHHFSHDIAEKVMRYVDTPITITYQRNGNTGTTIITPQNFYSNGFGTIGVTPYLEPLIQNVSNGMPAYNAGLRPGDRIVLVDGFSASGNMLYAYLQVKTNQPLTYIIKRHDSLLTNTIAAQKTIIGNNTSYMIGIVYASNKNKTLRHIQPKPLPTALGEGIKLAVADISLTVQGIGKLISGSAKAKNTVGGPIMIIGAMASYASVSFAMLLMLTARISLLLGFFNLLPIPAVDGSYILFFIIEGITGKPLNRHIVGNIQRIGLLVLLGLMLLVTVMDIHRCISGM